MMSYIFMIEFLNSILWQTRMTSVLVSVVYLQNQFSMGKDYNHLVTNVSFWENWTEIKNGYGTIGKKNSI